MKTFFLAAVLLAAALPPSAAAAADIRWQSWSPQVLEQARTANKPVFLYLEAVWCHWCHVMQQTTLADAGVRERLAQDFIAVRVDHDANPLLANRYRDYGWPALIFFAPDGTEIVKRAGFIETRAFSRLLAAILADPTPEEETLVVQSAATHLLDAAHRQDLQQRHTNSYDRERGGLRTVQKYIDRDSVEYAIANAQLASERRKAEQTLTAARALLDPVWGGMYQYSTGGDWAHPHYEKIMRTQAGALRVYSLAYGTLKRSEDLLAADRIRDYLQAFLRAPSGAYYVSQNADLVSGRKSTGYYALDDAGRRKLGIPRIDRSLYSDANGLAAEALALHGLYAERSDSLKAADAAMRWVDRHRAGALGGLRHGESPDKLEYLLDNLAPARAALALYRASGDRHWLQRAMSGADHIAKTFAVPGGGLATASLNAKPLNPQPSLEENISAARFLNLAYRHSGNPVHQQAAESAMRWSLGADRAAPSIEEAGLLLADEELSRPPLHLTVVGSKNDPQARALFRVASSTPGWYVRAEWLDRAEGPLPDLEIRYPQFPRAAGYSCEAQRCSAPSFTPENYRKAIDRLLHTSAGE